MIIRGYSIREVTEAFLEIVPIIPPRQESISQSNHPPMMKVAANAPHQPRARRLLKTCPIIDRLETPNAPGLEAHSASRLHAVCAIYLLETVRKGGGG